jgi:hypothetical protein
MIKGFCILISSIVAAAMAAGAANDYQAFRLEALAGVPIPDCANVSLLLPPCR